ncbi:lysine--tRNA ligase [Candidatus Peregrinibacteria bacterium]|nr:lysine--tRNA ligase [Candidatus Peregrinibacteria bacterium]
MSESKNPSNNENQSTTTNEYSDRQRKLQELRDQGVQAYREKFERNYTTAEALEFSKNTTPRALEEIVASPNTTVKLAGRLMLLRPHGKLTFGHLKDHTGRIQICFMQDFLGVEAYKMLKKIDLGDFIGVTGELFITKHGEATLLVKQYELLSKTLRPLPEKFHGLEDTETKYRYRYLDLLSDDQTWQRFKFRTSLIKEIRSFLDQHGFDEIETPILTSIASGAAAKPFETHHNALDIPMYLRIAPETYLKRAIVGGYDRVYEFAKCFRNEGIDPSHLQEFTMLEYYASYWNYQDNMDFTERMIKHVLKTLLGTLKVELVDREGQKQSIDFSNEWPRLNFVELIKGDCGIDILDHYGDAPALLSAIKAKGIQIEKGHTMGYGNLCDALYKKVSRPKLIQPCFVINHPVDTKPLARRNDQDARLADTFQLLVNTWEVINAYSELVDPLDQRARLEGQAAAKDAGDEEAMPMDEDYIYAMEHGMPPMSGWGMGIDRFTALLTNQDNLKDTVLFPIMRPLDHHAE